MPKKVSRTTSKRLTALSLVGLFGLAFYGIFTHNNMTAEIIAVMAPASVALLTLYMGIGHLDLRSLAALKILDLRKDSNSDLSTNFGDDRIDFDLPDFDTSPPAKGDDVA